MGYADWQLLAQLAQSDTDGRTINLPGHIRARREGGILFLDAVSQGTCGLP
jgi:hypothetical protein